MESTSDSKRFSEAEMNKLLADLPKIISELEKEASLKKTGNTVK